MIVLGEQQPLRHSTDLWANGSHFGHFLNPEPPPACCCLSPALPASPCLLLPPAQQPYYLFHPDVEDSTLRRFLKARDLDVKKAADFLLKHLAWRREAVPTGFISESEVQNELAQKKLFCQGFDKKGRPIGVAFGCKHNAWGRDLNEFKRK
ncbi:hypothetical protein KSP40_PGU018474 [Platanthera guangdongensis]|uniref:CRAL/TRIO N-terminal domain-containing protein n=1 Tax=Platanthera guangdongensis TaxID=2320717 RepID=A0ABR2N230_9ASPA